MFYLKPEALIKVKDSKTVSDLDLFSFLLYNINYYYLLSQPKIYRFVFFLPVMHVIGFIIRSLFLKEYPQLSLWLEQSHLVLLIS
jgi:hypothetical protein